MSRSHIVALPGFTLFVGPLPFKETNLILFKTLHIKITRSFIAMMRGGGGSSNWEWEGHSSVRLVQRTRYMTVCMYIVS